MKATPPNTLCRFCGTSLDALAQRRGSLTCGSARCRHEADRARTAALQSALANTAPAAARAQLPHLETQPLRVVWLKHCEPRMTAVTDEDRARHRAYLESVVADGMIIDLSRLAPSTADDTHPQGGRLCGQCRGRCCEHGAGWRAFLDLVVLQRWEQENPGRTLAHALEAYVSFLPAEHVEGACLYQTATGCAMPRERRAEICNGFACEALQQVQRAARENPQSATLAITFHKDRVERAAVIRADATDAVTLESTVSALRATNQT
jgi:hypothetical protein